VAARRAQPRRIQNKSDNALIMKLTNKSLIAALLLSLYFIFLAAPVFAAIGDTASSKIIPECLLGSKIDPSCDNINIFIWLGINVGFYLFSFIGALALLVFVYGGFMLILSQGVPDKVSKGKNAMVAAVVGLVIAFSAYALVTFLSNTIGVKTQYQLNMETHQNIRLV